MSNDEVILCPCCMQYHAVKRVSARQYSVFKEKYISFDIDFFYCENTDTAFETEEQMSANDLSMKNAYRRKMGLPESDSHDAS